MIILILHYHRLRYANLMVKKIKGFKHTLCFRKYSIAQLLFRDGMAAKVTMVFGLCLILFILFLLQGPVYIAT